MTRLTRSRGVGLLEGQSPPRVRHAPAQSRANSWEDVADLSARFGVVLDEWQELVLQSVMGERSDGRWVTTQVGISTPRQNGKSQLIVARALAGILLFGERLIIISAHQQDTAREIFGRLVDILEEHPYLDERVESYGKALNREYIRFKSGQVIRFKARSSGGGRGFSCDCLMLDEAQILSPAAWAAILPTMSARPNPQVWLLGTPPTPQDDGEVFGRLRQAGLDGRHSRIAYLEWSADVGDDLDDPSVWAKANPAFGSRISFEAIELERAAMDDAQFAMERLGMWASTSSLAAIDASRWSRLAVPASPAGRPVYAFDMDPGRERLTVAVAVRADERIHVEVAERRPPGPWLAAWFAPRAARGMRVLVDQYSPALSLVPDLEAAGVEVTIGRTRDMVQACGAFLDAVNDGSLTHFDQPSLNAAVAGARKRAIGADGGFGWDRRGDADISPLVAVTLAAHGLRTAKRERSSVAVFA